MSEGERVPVPGTRLAQSHSFAGGKDNKLLSGISVEVSTD